MGRRNRNQFEMHDFYCIKCGAKIMTLPRQTCHKHEAFHKKALWCPYCQEVFNAVEVTNDEEAYTFKENFENGVYREE